MNISVDISYKSLNKHHEELCGDKVEFIKRNDSDILILADGMGSGVKANILATLTSKILGTMLLNGAPIEDCVETIVKTLPVCQVRQVAYSTFSILQLFHNKEAYLIEFDNPNCIFVRDGKLQEIIYEERVLEGRKIKEAHFQVQTNDCFVLMSDGAIYAGVGKILNFGWTWNSVAEYAEKASRTAATASRLASMLSKACDDLYMQMPGDDTTIAVAKIINEKSVHLFTGPPSSKEDDTALIREFMRGQAKRVISGGTSANIASRVLNRPIKTNLNYTDPTLPPVGHIDGIDLVTEGVLTLSRTLQLLKQYADGNIDENFFLELDKDNGGSKIAKIIVEECTKLHLFIGKAINEAHQNPGLPFDLSIRMNLVEQMKDAVAKMGKDVEITYF